jgi:NodT family efflux transporter outer membrane factor (OMF) lipoprotein
MIRPAPTACRRAILFLALASTACATLPDPGTKAVARAPAIQEEAAATLTGDATAWPAERWWTHYGDPQLVGLIEEAVAGSPDLDVAAARVRVADGLARRAGAALQPRLDAFGNAGAMRLSQNIGVPGEIVPDGWNDAGSFGVSASLDLDLWGKNRKALRAARRDADAARFEAAEARLALTTAVAAAYADLAALHARHDSQSRALSIRTETLELVAERVERGLDNATALRQAHARLAQTRADLAATDEALALTRHALAALCGTGPDRAQAIGRPSVATLRAQGLPADASIALLGRRPDIAAARARVEAADERIGEARAAFYPNVLLTALVGQQALGLDQLTNPASTFGAVGPAVTLPIFHGGALRGQYRTRQGEHDEAVALYDREVIEALRETADAVTSLRMLAARLEQQRGALADFEEASRLARLRYGQGLATYLDVLTAEEGVLESRLQVASLQTRGFALDIALIRALGGGFQAS